MVIIPCKIRLIISQQQKYKCLFKGTGRIKPAIYCWKSEIAFAAPISNRISILRNRIEVGERWIGGSEGIHISVPWEGKLALGFAYFIFLAIILKYLTKIDQRGRQIRLSERRSINITHFLTAFFFASSLPFTSLNKRN